MTVKYPAFHSLEGKRVVLASASPRRIGIFKLMGLVYEIIPSKFEEDLDKNSYKSPVEYCMATCLKKAQMVRDSTLLDSPDSPPSVIISSDTIAICNGEIFEKPIDKMDAARMLSIARSQTVQIITAVTIMYRVNSSPTYKYEESTWFDTTELHMDDYDQAMIDYYLETGDGMDHSGALAYQGDAFLLIKGINGCFYNLIGFPAPKFYKEFCLIASKIN